MGYNKWFCLLNLIAILQQFVSIIFFLSAVTMAQWSTQWSLAWRPVLISTDIVSVIGCVKIIVEILPIILSYWPVLFCSCNLHLNLDYLRDVLWYYLALVRVYTKKRGGEVMASLILLFCPVILLVVLSAVDPFVAWAQNFVKQNGLCAALSSEGQATYCLPALIL